MNLIRRWLILIHRYLGIPLSALFVLWFASGIVMMYSGGMPILTPELRLERRAAIDPARIHLTPAEAAGVGAFGGLFLAVCYRSLNWERLKQAVYS